MYTLDPNYMYVHTLLANLRSELEEDRIARRASALPTSPGRSRRRQPRILAALHWLPDPAAGTRPATR
jgi:hypothetical protein